MLSATRNISLVGFMGTGKTSVGKALGRQSSRNVIDVDQWIENRTRKKIREIFEREGEPHFRALEKEAVAEVAKLEGVVITTGGGAVLDAANVAALKKSGWLVALSAKPETIFERVKDSRNRPLLKCGPTVETRDEIVRLLNARAPFYAKADYTFETDGLSPDQVAQLILETLEKGDHD